jgi:hypothetical protein
MGVARGFQDLSASDGGGAVETGSCARRILPAAMTSDINPRCIPLLMVCSAGVNSSSHTINRQRCDKAQAMNAAYYETLLFLIPVLP